MACHELAAISKLEEILAPRTKKMVEQRRGTTAVTSRQGASSREVDEIVSMVGQKLSDLRRAKGMSLQQLAEVSDVSPAAIHKIERSGMVPTITTLLKLATPLGVTVSYFVEDDESSPELVHYAAADRRQPVYTPHKGLKLSGITGSYRQFQTAAAIAQMAPGATSGEKILNHSGEELVHVMSGEVYFRVNGHEYTLKPGDSLQFNGNVPHHWENRGKKPAQLIWIVFRNGD